jgi:plastocyanin
MVGKPVAAAALLAFFLGGCAENGFAGQVELADDYFEPDAMSVAAGTELTFEVEESAEHPHTVTVRAATDPEGTYLLNENLTAGEQVPFDFEEPGTYMVLCLRHAEAGMTMEVTVH